MSRWHGLLAGLLLMLGTSAAQAFDPTRIDRLAAEADFHGVMLVSQGDTIAHFRAYGERVPGSGQPHDVGARWRWASITKQIIATIVMQEVEAGRIDLDAPIARYWPDFPNARRDTITVRHLLSHRSALPNPEDTPIASSGVPVFYLDEGADIASAEGYCAGPVSATPGERYSYNNCDFIVLGTVLERATGGNIAELVRERISDGPRFFPDGEPTVAGYHHGGGEPPYRFASYGSAGALNGTIRDLWHFNRALMRGDLIGDAAREEMWAGDPASGYAALGQWVLPVRLDGCDEPVRLVERHGGIGGVQARSFILPERDIVVIAFTNRSEADFSFGQVWRGEGFAHALLSEAACHWDESDLTE